MLRNTYFVLMFTLLSGCTVMVDGQPVDTGGAITLGNGELIVLGFIIVGMFVLARKND